MGTETEKSLHSISSEANEICRRGHNLLNTKKQFFDSVWPYTVYISVRIIFYTRKLPQGWIKLVVEEGYLAGVRVALWSWS